MRQDIVKHTVSMIKNEEKRPILLTFLIMSLMEEFQDKNLIFCHLLSRAILSQIQQLKSTILS